MDITEKAKPENIKKTHFIAKACGIGALGAALTLSPLGHNDSKAPTDGRPGEDATPLTLVGMFGLVAGGAAAAAVFMQKLNEITSKNKEQNLFNQAARAQIERQKEGAMSTGYTTENSFVVAEGEEGELYIFMQAKKEQPKAPRIIYDGRDHAVFMRNTEQKIILDYIHPDIREKLRHSRQVIIVETILENIKDSYVADMQYVESIPVDWSKIGLKSWEEVLLH